MLEDLGGQKPIDFKAGEKRAREIKAIKYLECTAKDISTVSNVFRQACKYLLDVEDKRKQKIAKLAKKEVSFFVFRLFEDSLTDFSFLFSWPTKRSTKRRWPKRKVKRKPKLERRSS